MEGIARYTYETSKRLILNNPDIEFHFLFDRSFDNSFIFGDNVIPHVIFSQSRHPILWHWWFEYSLPKFFSKNKIDVFYSPDMYLSLKAQVPTLYVSHDLNYLHYPQGLKSSHLKFYKKYMPKYHKAADKIIAVSEATKADVINHFDLNQNKIEVAGNALPGSIKRIESDKQIELRKKLTKGSPYFCYVGSLHPRKNVKNLIVAYDLFRSQVTSRVKLVLYGRMAWKTSDIISQYENSKFKSDIIFADTQAFTVSEVLSASTGLCYISKFEGFGIPILEAFECQTPVITSNISSMPEVAGDAALLVNPNSTKEIMEAMILLVKDQALANSLISKGKEQLRKYSWDKTAKTIFENLTQIAKST